MKMDGHMAERILIVDDEENIRQMLRLTLEASGYEVREAPDGMKALAILQHDSKWEAVLLDQRMPQLEGTEVLRRLKTLTPSTPVVMMTAFASIDLAVEAMKFGAVDFLRKPMTPEMVRNSVSAAKLRRLETEAAPVAVTLNGFALLRSANYRGADSKTERRFLVRRPDGTEQHVLVEISTEAIEAARAFMHDLSIEATFWTNEAETFLTDFIWNDGNVPSTGRLVLKAADEEHLQKLLKREMHHEQSNTPY